MGRFGWIRVVVVAGLAAFVAAGCNGNTTAPGGGGEQAKSDAAPASVSGGAVIARYRGKTFTEGDLKQELARLNSRSRKALEDVERRKQFVENHVLSDLIFEEGKSKGIDQDPEVRQQLRDLERRLVIQRVMQEHQSAPVTDEEVDQYYKSHPEEFSSDRVRASHILVKEEALAKEILGKLRADASQFAALAKEYSTDKSNSGNGGDLGFFGRGRMVKEFEDATFGLTQDGQISEVIKTRFGYHIIMRTGREDGALKPFDEVKNQIRIRLINDKRKTKTEQFLEELKTSAGYQLDAAALNAIDFATVEDASDTESADAPEGGGGH
jgi:peptidyl-prolyl cis-trans isomerase C